MLKLVVIVTEVMIGFTGDDYFRHAFGDRIDIKTASSYLTQYLNTNGLDGHINIVFSSDLDCR